MGPYASFITVLKISSPTVKVSSSTVNVSSLLVFTVGDKTFTVGDAIQSTITFTNPDLNPPIISIHHCDRILHFAHGCSGTFAEVIDIYRLLLIFKKNFYLKKERNVNWNKQSVNIKNSNKNQK